MNNYVLKIAYDGSRYKGWQRLGGSEATVQGKIENVLSEMLGHKIEIHGSGRTDAGVHALGQTASFKADTDMAPAEIMEKLNRYLPEDIAVTHAAEAEERFHARLCAKEKVYVYRLWTKPYPDVFRRRYMYSVGKELDPEKMREGAGVLCRRSDFIGYSSLKKSKKSTVRTVSSIDVLPLDGEVRLVFTGDGFLYNSVRIMAGSLMEVGLGKREAESLGRPFETLDRADAGITLPANGLTLLEVRY